LFLGAGDHILYKEGNPDKQLDMVTNRKVLRFYHGKVIRLLEVLYVVVCQQRITRQVGGNGISLTRPG
jgi:hypothetical protein